MEVVGISKDAALVSWEWSGRTPVVIALFSFLASQKFS